MTTHSDVSALRALRRSTLIALVATVALVPMSCSITEPGRSAQARELAENRQRWAGARLHDYEFDYQLSCFCPREATERVRITVRGDQVATATRSRDGLPAVRNYGSWPTVAALFDDVQQQLERKAERLDVNYDPTYGYPSSIVVDVYLNALDDESSQSASNLRPLP